MLPNLVRAGRSLVLLAKWFATLIAYGAGLAVGVFTGTGIAQWFSDLFGKVKNAFRKPSKGGPPEITSEVTIAAAAAVAPEPKGFRIEPAPC